MSRPMTSAHILCRRISNYGYPKVDKKTKLRGGHKNCTDKCQVSGRKCQQVTSQAASGHPAKTCHMSPRRDLCEREEKTPRRVKRSSSHADGDHNDRGV